MDQSLLSVCGIEPCPTEPDLVEVYINLWVWLGHRFLELELQAKASLESLLLANSPSIHRRCLRLMREVGGHAGVIDVETDEFLLLDDPTRKICVDHCRYLDWDFDPEDGGTDYDVDGFASALLTEYRRAIEGQG